MGSGCACSPRPPPPSPCPRAFAAALPGAPRPARPSGDAVDALAATLDTRAVTSAVVPTAAARDAATALLGQPGAGARATWDERFGTLRSVRGPRLPDALPPSGSARRRRPRLGARQRSGVRPDAPPRSTRLAVVRDHALPGTGTHVVDFVQTAGGVAAARGGRLNVAVTKDGRVLSYAGDPTPGREPHRRLGAG